VRVPKSTGIRVKAKTSALPPLLHPQCGLDTDASLRELPAPGGDTGERVRQTVDGEDLGATVI
jgi:hypothetical protein